MRDCHAGAVLVLWAVVRWSPPGFWPADLFLYGPRWAASIPLLPLAPLAARLRLGRSALGLALAPAALLVYRRDWAGYTNAFSGTRWGLGHTMFTRRMGLRIDHVLAGAGWRPERCWVGPEVGSAHRPLIAEFAWLGPPPP